MSTVESRSVDLRSLIILLLLVLIGLFGVVILWSPMLSQGYPSTHSTHFNLSWGFQYQRQFFSGQIYPRWLEFSNFGFGNATFAFYPPLCMVATLPFRALGFDLHGSLVGSMGLAIGGLGLGLYGYGRCYFPRWIALAVAGIGMASPYFLIDIYQRGAIGEVWAITVLPWILWASDRVLRHPQSYGPILALGLSYGGLVLSHLPTLLLFTLIWIPLPWMMAVGDWRSRGWGAIRCYGGAALALGWTAFYLWPAALDQRFIQVDTVNALPDYRPQNRLIVWGLRQLQLQVTDHWFEKDLLGPWLLIGGITLIALMLLGVQRGHKPEPEGSWLGRMAAYWVGITLFTLLMMTDLLSWIYPLTGVLERIQFSWRWLGITTVLLPLIWGYLLQQAALWRGDLRRFRQLAGLWLAVGCFVMAAGVIGQSTQVLERAVFVPQQVDQFVQLSEQKQFPEEPQQRPGEAFLFWHWIFPDGLALVDVPEYRAEGVVMAMPPDRIYPLVAWADQMADADIPAADQIPDPQWEFGRRRFIATNDSNSPRLAVLRTFYYPGWRVQIDGQGIPTQKTDLGQIQIPIPPGNHQITVTYRGTAMDWIGQGASVISIVLAIGIGYLWRVREEPLHHQRKQQGAKHQNQNIEDHEPNAPQEQHRQHQ